MRGAVALAAVLGTWVLSCASASAKMTQIITSASTPPSTAVAGVGSYEVSATSSSGLPVGALVLGACSLTKPQPNLVSSLAEVEAPHSEPREPVEIRKLPQFPQTVYFVSPGECHIYAYAEGYAEYERAVQALPTIGVSTNPLEQTTFTSITPSNATVGGSYVPAASSSAGLRLWFISATPSVCPIVLGSIPLSFVSFRAPGTCTIEATQVESSPNQAPLVAPEAQQSFTVFENPAAPATAGTTEPVAISRGGAPEPKVKTTRTTVKKTPTKRHRAQCPTKKPKCATLIIHVYGYGGPAGDRGRGPGGSHVLEGERLRIRKLAVSGAVLNSVETSTHKVRLTPGRYEVTAETGGPSSESTKVVLRARETRAVTIKLSTK